MQKPQRANQREVFFWIISNLLEKKIGFLHERGFSLSAKYSSVFSVRSVVKFVFYPRIFFSKIRTAAIKLMTADPIRMSR